jgi:hypothetical protein
MTPKLRPIHVVKCAADEARRRERAEAEAIERHEQEMADAMGSVLDAIRPLESDSARMRVLAAASCMYGADNDARWFLAKAVRGTESRCGRCGHVYGLTTHTRC